MPDSSPHGPAGRLEGVSPVELVWSLARAGRTGVLSVTGERGGRTLWLERGRAVFATTSFPEERIGERLLRARKIRLKDLERALAAQGDGGGRLGRLLVEAGALEAGELDALVRDQLRAVARELLLASRGSYRFDEGALPDRPEITLGLETAELVLAAIRATRRVRRVLHEAGPLRTAYRLTPRWREVAGGLELDEGERLVLERLESGPTTLGELCEVLYLPGFDIARTAWAFRLLGLATAGGAVDAGDDRAGRLEATDFPSLLLRLGRDGATGILRVGRGGVERSFHIREGRCVFATSDDAEDGLVAFLLRRGVIALGDVEETSRRALSNKRVGTLLREMGVLDERDLQEMVREHLQEIVEDTVTWIDGEWLFEPGPLPTAEPITLDVPLETLVADGVRRVRSWTRVLRGCGGLDRPIGLTPHYLGALDAMGAGVDEWDVVSALRRPQTPRRVCRVSKLGELETCRILWTLMLLEAVEPRPMDDLAADDEATADDIVTEVAGDADRGEATMGTDPTPPVAAGEQAEASRAPPEPASPDWTPPADLDEAIARFNEVHQVIWRTARREIGAGAPNFVRSCCASLAGPGGAGPVGDAELSDDGCWSHQGLLRAAEQARIENPWTAYRRVIETELERLRDHLGRDSARRLERELEEMARSSTS